MAILPVTLVFGLVVSPRRAERTVRKKNPFSIDPSESGFKAGIVVWPEIGLLVVGEYIRRIFQ